jgi:hypothetical protein
MGEGDLDLHRCEQMKHLEKGRLFRQISNAITLGLIGERQREI